MQWNVYSLDQYPNELWQDWQQLVMQHHQSNPMLCSDLVRLLVEYFADEVYVARGEQNKQLVALLLLEKGKRGVWRGFKPSQAQVALFVSDQSVPLQVNLLPAKCPSLCIKIDLFSVDPLEHSNLLADIAPVHIDTYAQNIRIDINSDFEKYWEGRPRKLRQNVNRYQNRLSREVGDYIIKSFDDPKGILEATDRYGLLEAQGWKGKLGTALHPSNLQGQFYREFLGLMAKNNSAIVFEMWLNDELIASRLCLNSSIMLVTLKTTFDEKLKKHAVGRILLKELLEFVFKQQFVKKIDFYTNATSDQIDWSTEQRPMYNISVFGDGTITKLIQALLALRNKFQSSPKVNVS